MTSTPTDPPYHPMDPSAWDTDHDPAYQSQPPVERKQKCCPRCGDPLFTNRFHSCALVAVRKSADRQLAPLMEALKRMPKAEPLYEDDAK